MKNIDCNFGFENFGSFINISCCNVVKNVKIDTENVILNITNAHKSNYNKAFSAKNKEIYYLPQGIGHHFIYLEFLEIYNSGLKKITAKILKEFYYLKYLSLSHNDIEYLESDLFQYNIGLVTINLNNNQISLIEPTFLKTKQYLTTLAFVGNVCYSGTAKDEVELDNVIEVMKMACSNVVRSLNNNLVEYQKKIEACDKKQLKLNESIKILTNKSDKNNKRMTNYEKEIGDMKKLRNSLNNVENNSKAFIEKINTEIENMKTCPSSIAELNKTIVAMIRNDSLKIENLENKYTEIVNKATNMEKDISLSKSNVLSTENKINHYEAELSTIKANSSNLSVNLNKIWIEIGQINGKIDDQRTDLTKKIYKHIEDLQTHLTKLSQNLTTLRDKLAGVHNNLTEKIDNHIESITSLIINKINDTTTIFNKYVENLRYHSDVNITKIQKAIKALAAIHNETIEKLANHKIQIGNNFDLLALSFNEKLENQTLNFNDKLKTTKNQMQQDSTNVTYLIISNIILIILLVLTFSCLIYSLKFKSNKQIQSENSNYQQFSTISTHFPDYDQNIEPIYATTDFNEEPIYEAYASYNIGDPKYFEATDDAQYSQGDTYLYETTDEPTVQEQNHQSYECVGHYEASIYERMTNHDDQYYKADKSKNEPQNTVVYESGDDSIYEVAEHVGTMKAESMTSTAVFYEDLYAEIPVKMNDEQEQIAIYAVVKKS